MLVSAVQFLKAWENICELLIVVSDGKLIEANAVHPWNAALKPELLEIVSSSEKSTVVRAVSPAKAKENAWEPPDPIVFSFGKLTDVIFVHIENAVLNALEELTSSSFGKPFMVTMPQNLKAWLNADPAYIV